MKQQYANEISHRRFCRTDRNCVRTVGRGGGGASAWYCETNCINPLDAELNPICHLLAFAAAPYIYDISSLRGLFLQKVFSSDHKSNLKWAILGTQCACHLPPKTFFLMRLRHQTVTWYNNCALSISFSNSVCVHITVKYNKTVLERSNCCTFCIPIYFAATDTRAVDHSGHNKYAWSRHLGTQLIQLLFCRWDPRRVSIAHLYLKVVSDYTCILDTL
jgi:hypothetical protein